MEKAHRKQSGIIKSLSRTFSMDKLDFLDKAFEDNVCIGLDIGSFSVKAVEFRKTASGLLCTSVGYREITGEDSSQKPQKAQSPLSEALRKMWQENKLSTNKVRLVLSDAAIYSRHISVPRVAEEELSKAIKWQAEKYVPFPIEDAIVDFQHLSTSSKQTDNQMDIVIVAVEKNVIDNYISLLQSAKLVPVHISFSPFAVANLLSQNYLIDDNEIVPVVDIGAKRTSILLVKGKSLLLVRSLECAGEQFTEKIAHVKNVNRQKAEEFKRSYTGKEQDLNNAFEPLLSDLASQVTRSIAYCEKDFPAESINRIILCGGGAVLNSLDQYIQAKVGLPVEMAYPFKNIKVNEKKVKISGLEEYSAKLMGAAGEAVV